MFIYGYVNVYMSFLSFFLICMYNNHKSFNTHVKITVFFKFLTNLFDFFNLAINVNCFLLIDEK